MPVTPISNGESVVVLFSELTLQHNSMEYGPETAGRFKRFLRDMKYKKLDALIDYLSKDKENKIKQNFQVLQNELKGIINEFVLFMNGRTIQNDIKGQELEDHYKSFLMAKGYNKNKKKLIPDKVREIAEEWNFHGDKEIDYFFDLFLMSIDSQINILRVV
ncbi:MAG: hypothetical protein GY782_12380 [Gammaproteobacteria bacterium]|nr:hypothetical protein [Gammaproteobacteria bacterium]